MMQSHTVSVPTSLNFSAVEELEKCLTQYHVDSARWNGAKVETLFDDLKKGECVLEAKEGQLHRRVNVVSVRCFHTNQNQERLKLVEEKQVLADGKIRQRGYEFVSETMKPNETPLEASVRALAEELQISDPELQFQATPEYNEDKTKDSTTYVGIPTHYIVYHFKTEIPTRLFKETYVENEGGNTTYFKWVKA